MTPGSSRPPEVERDFLIAGEENKVANFLREVFTTALPENERQAIGWVNFKRTIAIAVVLGLFDLAATALVGFECELNPLMRWLFGVSPWAGAAFKLAMLVLLALAVPALARRAFTFAYRCVQLIVLVYALAALLHVAALSICFWGPRLIGPGAAPHFLTLP